MIFFHYVLIIGIVIFLGTMGVLSCHSGGEGLGLSLALIAPLAPPCASTTQKP